MGTTKFELPAGMSAMTFTQNDDGTIMSIAVSVPYSRPFGSYIFLVRCNYNPDIEDCLENKLTRASQFESWESKCVLLTTFIDENLSKFESISPTVTGVTFRSRVTGPPFVWTYEDLSHSLVRIRVCHVRFHPLVPRSKLAVTSTAIFGKFPCYDAAEFNGMRYVLRRHDFAWDNNYFKHEIIAHEKGISRAPHVLPISMLVRNASFEVDGFLLPWCEQGSIEYLLHHRGTEIAEPHRIKWISQMAHALVQIHSMHLSHGNLTLRTIFVDKNWNIHLTGFMLGLGYRSALGGDPTPEKSLAWDVFCLGKVIVELIANDLRSETSQIGTRDIEEEDTKGTYLRLARRCSAVMISGEALNILEAIAQLAHCGCIL